MLLRVCLSSRARRWMMSRLRRGLEMRTEEMSLVDSCTLGKGNTHQALVAKIRVQ
jgi:hypothetical protein